MVGRTVGHIFYARKLFSEYLYHGFEYNKLMGIILLPILLLAAYTPLNIRKYVLLVTIGLILLLFMAKVLRLIIFSLRNRVLNVYLFFYLCALEIVPYLLLYKGFSELVWQG